jgi:hypothetical protein
MGLICLVRGRHILIYLSFPKVFIDRTTAIKLEPRAMIIKANSTFPLVKNVRIKEQIATARTSQVGWQLINDPIFPLNVFSWFILTDYRPHITLPRLITRND